MMLHAVFAALLFLLSPPQEGSHPRPSNRPLKTATFDLRTRTLTRDSSVEKSTNNTTFSNLDNNLARFPAVVTPGGRFRPPSTSGSGFVGVDTGGGFHRWVDSGVKGTGTPSACPNGDLMSSITFDYCSAMKDTTLGGPGGGVRLGFYEGYQKGGGAPTTQVAAFTLTGLPANSTSSSFFPPTGAGFDCFRMTVLFDPPLYFDNGPIGYSWTFIDTGADGVLAGTAPVLACVDDCMGIGPDDQGMTDCIDRYGPPDTLQETFSFAPRPPYGEHFTSMSMEIVDIDPEPATAFTENGSNKNLDIVEAKNMVIGQNWTAPLTIGHLPGLPGSAILRIRTNIRTIPYLKPFGCIPGGSELLIRGPKLFANMVATHNGNMGGINSFLIPNNPALICQPWAAQYIVLHVQPGSPPHACWDLSSAVYGVISCYE